MVKKEDVIEYLRNNPDALKGEFKISPAVATVRKTFEVEPGLVKEFMTEARRRNLKIKQAIDQAIRQWIGKGR